MKRDADGGYGQTAPKRRAKRRTRWWWAGEMSGENAWNLKAGIRL